MKSGAGRVDRSPRRCHYARRGLGPRIDLRISGTVATIFALARAYLQASLAQKEQPPTPISATAPTAASARPSGRLIRGNDTLAFEQTHNYELMATTLSLTGQAVVRGDELAAAAASSERPGFVTAEGARSELGVDLLGAVCRERGVAGAKLGSSVMFVAQRRAPRFASTLIADA
jgi:hypothetical protein